MTYTNTTLKEMQKPNTRRSTLTNTNTDTDADLVDPIYTQREKEGKREHMRKKTNRKSKKQI